MAAVLELDVEEFERRYIRRVGPRGKSLVEQANYDCIFYDPKGACRVYRARPRQCRTWPFWRASLRTAADWEMAAENCPGIGSGERHDAARITVTAERDGLP